MLKGEQLREAFLADPSSKDFDEETRQYLIEAMLSGRIVGRMDDNGVLAIKLAAENRIDLDRQQGPQPCASAPSRN
jgi:hypothetical protein